ncbi:hypothetical protein [Avibacterium paragallinarum]|uniref:hypothetical protein n=1 Tax=Avibacterium paragallinarum TaxID=728 RepID=UPI00397AC8F1
MKKLFSLTILALLVAGCDDSSPKQETAASSEAVQTQQTPSEEVKDKAFQPESQIKAPFTKTEKGRVIFQNVIDLFEEKSLYSPDDNDIIVHSKSPLKLTLKEILPNGLEISSVKELLTDRFISDIYAIFAHTDINQVELTLEAVTENGKPYGKKTTIKGKIPRERALKVMQTFSAMKTFDDYVEQDPNTSYITLGFSRSENAKTFHSEKYQTQILNALLTGKISPPYEMAPQPMNVDITKLKNKLIEVSQSLGVTVKDESKTLDNGNTERTLSLSEITKLAFVLNPKGEVIKVVTQFGFVSDQEYILQTLAAFGISVMATPHPEKSFKITTSMIDKIGKKLPKTEGSITETQNIDGYTITMTVHKSLGGLSYLVIEKLVKQPVVFE